MNEPIWIHCEGSGCRPACLTDYEGMCSMCGDWVSLDSRGSRVTDHDRYDLLAMLNRGDFNSVDG